MDATTSRTRPALARFNPAQPGAAGMKIAATGLLVLMAAIFAVTRAFEERYPWLSFVKAFAEAAMVGGLRRQDVFEGGGGRDQPAAQLRPGR